MRNSWWLVALVSLVTAGVLAMPAAAQTVQNGDFETGALRPWKAPARGNGGTWFVTPESPPQGDFWAVTEPTNPGARLLFQRLHIGKKVTQLSFVLAYFNTTLDDCCTAPTPFAPIHGRYAPKVSICLPGPILRPDTDVCEAPFCSPDTFDFNFDDGCNQQIRVDILREHADPWSLSDDDILMTLYRTQPGDPDFLPPEPMSFDLSPLKGRGSVILRFAEVDNLAPLYAGVDAITLEKASA